MAANPLFAIDDGYDDTDVVWADGNRLSSSVQPTLVSLSKRQAVNVARPAAGRDKPSDAHYRINGTVYAVGETVKEPLDTRYDDFAFSEPNLAVAIHAIRCAGVTSGPVNVVTGLPVTRYYNNDGQVREENLKRKVDAWRQPVTLEDGTECPRIAGVMVVSEAVAGWFNYVIDADYRMRESLLQEQVALVDVGGRTTDIAVVENGDVLREYSGTDDHGVLDVYHSVARQAADALGSTTKIPKQIVRDAVRTGVLRMGSRELDVSRYVEEAKRELTQRIAAFARSCLGTQADFINKVLFIGGGPLVLGDQLASIYPRIGEVPAHPNLANAMGMFKYGQLSGQEAESHAVQEAEA